jgi:nucleotide-binding universal stress UspA family protein
MRRFRNILFLADSDEGSVTALGRALRLAERNGARLTVMDVLEPVETPPGLAERHGIDLAELLRQRRGEALERLLAPHVAADALIYTKVLFGIPFVEVIRAVQAGGHDLVMKAARPPAGITQRLFGSTDMHLLRKCPCPVWIDRLRATDRYARVLATVDPMSPRGQGCDDMVMTLAGSLAEQEGADLAVVHAWQLEGESMLRHGRAQLPEVELEQLLDGMQRRHRGALARLLEAHGKDVHGPGVHLVKGPPAPAIRAVAEQLAVDVIVMGTVGRMGIPGFFIGNTAEEVLQTTQASVLAVKPAGFESPVG